MPKSVEEGSVWYVISMSWIKIWQEWSYINLITSGQFNEQDGEA